MLHFVLSQCAIDEFGYLWLSVFLPHTVGNASVDIRYFKALDTIMADICHQIYILYVELAVFLSLGKDLAEAYENADYIEELAAVMTAVAEKKPRKKKRSRTSMSGCPCAVRRS